jgi:prophage endopeptidase
MIAILGIFKIVPSWCWYLLIIAGAAYGCDLHGQHVVQARWNAFNVAQAVKNKEAIDKRVEDNTLLKTVQIGTSNNIQKAHDHEIDLLNTVLTQSKRLRVGPSFCHSIAGQTNTNSTTGGNGVDSSGRLLPPEVDAAVKSLILETEKAAATGRAAQAFIRENGMAP